jgi:hypothetical protein
MPQRTVRDVCHEEEGEPLQEPANGKLKGKDQRGSKDAYAA